MQSAAYICFVIAGLCISPFIIWLLVAIVVCIGEGIYNFIKKPNMDSIFEFLGCMFLLSLLLGAILHHLANR